MNSLKPGRIFFGGSFNPVHVGHLRLAMETLESLAGLAGGMEFLPSSLPPHKDSRGLLPFKLRTLMLKAALAELPGMACNELEASRSGPSYTYETMKICRELYPGEQLYFLLGSKDYAMLPHWYRGLEISSLCNFIVAPRENFSVSEFVHLSQSIWSDSAEDKQALKHLRYSENACAMKLPGGNRAYYLPLPHMPVSASRIRKLWLQGRNIEFLVAQPVLKILDKERQAVKACWQENNQSCLM